MRTNYKAFYVSLPCIYVFTKSLYLLNSPIWCVLLVNADA